MKKRHITRHHSLHKAPKRKHSHPLLQYYNHKILIVLGIILVIVSILFLQNRYANQEVSASGSTYGSCGSSGQYRCSTGSPTAGGGMIYTSRTAQTQCGINATEANVPRGVPVYCCNNYKGTATTYGTCAGLPNAYCTTDPACAPVVSPTPTPTINQNIYTDYVPGAICGINGTKAGLPRGSYVNCYCTSGTSASGCALTNPKLTALFNDPFFVGDSLTYGLVSTALSNSFPYASSAMMNIPITSNNVYGVSGITTEGMMQKIDSNGVIADAKGRDLIVVELGNNDSLFQCAPGATNPVCQTTPDSIATFTSEYNKLIKDLLTSSGTNPMIICTSLWFDSTNPSTTLNKSGISLQAYNDAIKSACAQSPKGEYLDIGKYYLVSGDRNTSGDSYHPNDAGHQAIAQSIYNYVVAPTPTP